MSMTRIFRTRLNRQRSRTRILSVFVGSAVLCSGSLAHAQTVAQRTAPDVVQGPATAPPQIYQTPEILGLSQRDLTTKLNQSFVLERGFKVATPVKLPERDRRTRGIECISYCHPYKLRRPVVSIRWPEGVSQRALRSTKSRAVPLAVQPSALRVDVADSRGGFQLQNYSTVALRTVPEVPTLEGMGPDLRRIDPEQKVVPLLEVREELIQTPQLIPELNAQIPTFERLLPEAPQLQDGGRGQQQLRLQQAPQLQLQRQDLQLQRPELQVQQQRLAQQAQIKPILKDDRPLFTALPKPYQTTMVVAQTVNRVPEIAERQLIVEGLEPGIAYRLRLVEELTDSSVELAVGVCPVPACPADFVEDSAN